MRVIYLPKISKKIINLFVQITNDDNKNDKGWYLVVFGGLGSKSFKLNVYVLSYDLH